MTNCAPLSFIRRPFAFIVSITSSMYYRRRSHRTKVEADADFS
jgi:hypothetical protein